jgi:dephospho-CoA kinase
MKLYGLTGGIGMGKSAAAEFLRQEGVAVSDTDDIAREVVAPGQEALAAITKRFGAKALDAAGRLDRKFLAEQVFSDATARQWLEALLHPLIRERWQAEAARWKEESWAAGVVVIPLLFETEAEKNFDKVICVACGVGAQSARLHERGWTAQQMRGRLSAQWPIERKMERSDYVVWNESSLTVLQEQLRRTPPLPGRVETVGKTKPERE